MAELFKGNFYNPTRGRLNFEQMIQEIIEWMKEKPDFFYEIIVGCDSNSENLPSFPVAIVVLRKGQGGRFFLKKINYPKKFYHWKKRVLQEVCLSCELALALKEKLKKKALSLNYQLKYIHADVGEGGLTRDMIREVIGIIKGNGFEPKIKPEAFVATNVADRYS